MDVKIKICGLFRDCDIECVNEEQPDYAGFIFYPPSHRFVTKEQMRRFRGLLDESIPAVGVFVDVPEEDAAGYLREGLIQIVQLHGQEDEAYIEKLRTLAPGCEVWKAFKVRGPSDLTRARMSSADKILLDNGYGTGQCFDWGLLEEEGQTLERPFLLAGGLNLENADEAIRHFHPWGIDVSSGVETDKKKDRRKIREMIRTVRRNR